MEQVRDGWRSRRHRPGPDRARSRNAGDAAGTGGPDGYRWPAAARSENRVATSHVPWPEGRTAVARRVFLLPCASARLPSVPSLCPIFGGLLPLVERNKRALRRSEEHTSELQSLMRISYAVFCLNKK